MLTSVAEFYEDEVNVRLGALVSLIEPLMLIFMGLLIAFIMISLYLPLFSFSAGAANG
jgi:type IV pilus assembly protein PilC